MIVLPVLDLLEGCVVRGIAGQRDSYRPIVSQLTTSSAPLDVVRAIGDRFGLNRFYIADLDGILKRRPNLVLLEQLIACGADLIVDSGISNPIDARLLQEIGITRLIVGLESCRRPEDLAEIVAIAPDVAFSLDLMKGIPRLPEDSIGWGDRPFEIVRQAAFAKVSAILPLDLADVGTGTGGSTDTLCTFIHDEFPQMELIAGGGIRGPDDLNRFHSLHVDSVLVASALHDERLSSEDVHAFD